jgi:hypothetical protein
MRFILGANSRACTASPNIPSSRYPFEASTCLSHSFLNTGGNTNSALCISINEFDPAESVGLLFVKPQRMARSSDTEGYVLLSACPLKAGIICDKTAASGKSERPTSRSGSNTSHLWESFPPLSSVSSLAPLPSSSCPERIRVAGSSRS